MFFAAVVDETRTLGSDGESVDVSPCSSEQYAASNGSTSDRYIVSVKMRQKTARKWSEVSNFLIMSNIFLINFLFFFVNFFHYYYYY